MTVVISGGKLDRLKDHAIAQMKADGMEYEQRLRHVQRVRGSQPVGRRGEHPAEVDRPRDVQTYKSFAESVLEYTSNDRLAPPLLSVLTTADAGLVPEEILEAPSVPEFGCPFEVI